RGQESVDNPARQHRPKKRVKTPDPELAVCGEGRFQMFETHTLRSANRTTRVEQNPVSGDMQAAPVSSEQSRFPRVCVRCNHDGNSSGLEKIVNLPEIGNWRSHMLNQVRAVNEMKLRVRRRVEILDFRCMRFKSSPPADFDS